MRIWYTGAALHCAADLCVSMQHGDGTFTYNDGQKYIGQYQFNLKEGFGVWSSASTGTNTLADSPLFVGSWPFCDCCC